MSAFLTALEVELIDDSCDPCKWRLEADLVYQSNAAETTFTVEKGFETDFASVPRLPLAYLFTGNTAHRPAVIHDYLYRTGIVSRAKADSVFIEAMEVTGMSWWRRYLMWAAVRTFGSSRYLLEEVK